MKAECASQKKDKTHKMPTEKNKERLEAMNAR